MITNSEIIEALQTVYDPEIPVNIYDLGLIYEIGTSADDSVEIQMTLTSPACPVAQTMPNQVKQAIKEATGAEDVNVDVVWDPPWDQSRMSEEAQLALNLM